MALGSSRVGNHGAWDHPSPAVCDGDCAPSSNTRELWHQRQPAIATLRLHGDTISGAAFRDDRISVAGVQTAGEVCWRLSVNDEVVESPLEEIEQVLADQLGRVREVIDALSRVPQPRGA